MNPALRHVAIQLTTLRMAAGLTQREVAERAGLGSDTVSDLECMRFQPTAAVVASIAEVFGLRLTVEPRSAVLLETTEDIGQELRRLRRSMGLTLNDVTRATGIHETNLSAYENDRRIPDTATLLRIVAALGCRLAIMGAR